MRSRRLKTAIKKMRSKCSATISCTSTRSSTMPSTPPVWALPLYAMSEDELIGWPARMPFLTLDEIDTLGEEEDDETADEGK